MVELDDLIGRQGTAGRSTGPHLHLDFLYIEPESETDPAPSEYSTDSLVDPGQCFGGPEVGDEVSLGTPASCFDGTAVTINGQRIVISPGHGVGIEFPEVTIPGVTTVAPNSGGAPAPPGHVASDPNAYFDISSTAEFIGQAIVCFDYGWLNLVGVPDILHWVGGLWENITIGNDPEDTVVCGATGSWSPFLLADRDTDLDSTADALDNCPNWPNPTQALPTWVVPPAGDSDCDGYTATRESRVGTDATDHCNADTVRNNEALDAWPPDFDDNQIVNLSDVLMFNDVFGLTPIDGNWNVRFDVYQSATEIINLSDILSLNAYFGLRCEPLP